jgi:N-methylhydantoinase A
VSVETAAAGVVTLIDDAMAKALRIVTVERGLDPRDFTIAAFGGGGPLHACALAEELGIAQIVIPAHPGIFSARGLLDADLAVNTVRSVLCVLDDLDVAGIERSFIAFEERARAALVEQGADASTVRFRREYDARYRGQSFELPVEHDRSHTAIATRFHDAHRARYGYDVPGEVVEIVNARLTASAQVVRHSGGPSAPYHPERSRRMMAREPLTRPLWLGGAFVEVPVFDRATLVADARIDGPAIVEAYDSTTYVAPNWRLAASGEMLVLQRTSVG